MMSVALFALVGCGTYAASNVDDTAPDDDSNLPDCTAGTLSPDAFALGRELPLATLVTSTGEEVCTSTLAGHPSVLHVRPIWSAPCESLTADTDDIRDAYAAYDLKVATLLSQNMDGENPDWEDAANFVTGTGMESPVLVDPSTRFVEAAGASGQLNPVYIINSELVIVDSSDCYTSSEVCALLAAMLGTSVPEDCP